MVSTSSPHALSLAVGLSLLGFAPEAEAVPFHSTPGPRMVDLDIGADGDVFGVGTDGELYHWIKGAWTRFGRRAHRVAVGPTGYPWIIDASHRIWSYDGRRWLQRSGQARAIDIGADGSVFILGQPTSANGYVYRWTGSSWSYFGGNGVEIAVAPDGRPWVINSARQVYRRNGSRYDYIPGEARDIDVGGDGTVYMLGGGWGVDGYVYRWNGSGWTYNGGYGVRITVAPTGAPALVNSANSVWGSFVKRLHGDTTCGPNERDCNVCARDVRQQFDRLFSGHRDDHHDTWELRWNTRYWPDLMSPPDAFDDGNLVAHGHVQGFVRTGSPTYPYVGSYSDDAHGSVFVVRADSAGNERLAYMHQSIGQERHPSGVHALGHYVGVIERTRYPHEHQLRFIDLDNPFGADILHPPPNSHGFGTGGGGIGLARLGRQRYLAVTTNPGGGGNDVRSSGVFVLDGSLETGRLTHLGTNAHQRPARWGQNYRTAENVSLITECETGQIYAVHVSGEPLDGGSGHWRLERLEHGPTGPVLRGLKAYTDWQNINRCFLRAAGTAYAGDDGIIDLYCHEYDMSHEAWETTENVDFVRREGRPLPFTFILWPF